MQQFKKYDKYKNSGLDWLGDVPSGWEVKRWKDVGNLVLGKMLNNKPEIGYELKSYLKSKNIGWLQIDSSSIEEMYFNKEEKRSYRVRKDDLLLSEGGEVGKTSIWNNEIDECYIQNSVHKITLNSQNNPKFYLYFSYYLGFSNHYDSRVNIVSIKHLTKEKLVNINIIKPPLPTQIKIAEFLDTRAAAIDAEIELLTTKAAKYKQLKQSLINQIVTKGLNLQSEMKDTEIDWIGSIPSSWKVRRGKEIFVENPKSKITANEGEKLGKYKFFTSSNVQSKWLDSWEYDKESILFSTGGIAGVHYCDKEYSYSTDTWSIYSLSNQVYLKYYSYYFQSILSTIKTLGFRGSGLEHLQKDFINQSGLPLPPKAEQVQIVEYLDAKTGEIDNIITAINDKISKLKQYRKVLINDVVNGKINVE